MGGKKDPVELALTKLQTLIRNTQFDPAKDLPAFTISVPDDLSTDEHQTLFLSSKERAGMEAARSVVLKDLRFEHLGRNDRTLDEDLSRFACLAHFDRKTDHVPVFMEEHGREPEEQACFIPIEALTVTDRVELFGISLLPVEHEEIPSMQPWFTLEPPIGSVAVVQANGTHLTRMAERARAEAEQALRVLRIALRENRNINDLQLRFRLVDGYSFGEGLTGWQTAPDARWNLDLDARLFKEAKEQPLWQLGKPEDNDIHRRARLAVKWAEDAFFATDQISAMLFRFFALESILGDKSEGLKAPGLAFRRAMLSVATRGRFAPPDRTYLPYDRVRSAAVHGEHVPEVTEEAVRKSRCGLQSRRVGLESKLLLSSVETST